MHLALNKASTKFYTGLESTSRPTGVYVIDRGFVLK
jgi:hypothetical protein